MTPAEASVAVGPSYSAPVDIEPGPERLALEALLKDFRRVPVVPSTHTEAAELANNDWVRAHGLVKDEASFQQFKRIGCGSFAAHTYPFGSLELITMGAHLISWLFLFDDFHGEGWASPTEGHLQAMFGRCERVLREELMPSDSTPFYYALLDLRNTLACWADEHWLGRFADSLCSYFSGCRLEYQFRIQRKAPSLAEYRTLRAHSIGAAPVFDLIEVGLPETLTPEQAAKPEIRDMRTRAARLCAWTNDVYSYEKERRAGDPVNLIEVLVHESDMTVNEAFAEAVTTYNREHAEMVALAEKFVRVPGTSPVERLFAYGLIDWVNGNTAWTPTSGRY